MYKYTMTINGEPYTALFIDHIEAADFLDANDQDGNVTIINKIEKFTIQEILDRGDFEQTYLYEVIANYLAPEKHFKKTSECEDFLRLMGWID